MRVVKAILASFKFHMLCVVAVVIIAFIFAETLIRLLFGEPFYPVGIFYRFFVAWMLGIVAMMLIFASQMLFAFRSKSGFDPPQSKAHMPRGKSYGSGFEQTIETAHIVSPVAEKWAGEGFSGGGGGEMGASDMYSDSGSDGGGGGDYGGDGGGGGGSGGGWS